MHDRLVPWLIARLKSVGLPIKLDIGCSETYQEPLDEWLHLDRQPHEHVEMVRDWGNINLPDGCVNEIFLGDVVEHIPQWEWKKTLCEWNRICCVGAAVTGRTPNFDRQCHSYVSGELTLRDVYRSVFGGAWESGQQHFICFTKEVLTELFARFGFEVEDYSGSPGPKEHPWWLVFRGQKVRDLIPEDLTKKLTDQYDLESTAAKLEPKGD